MFPLLHVDAVSICAHVGLMLANLNVSVVDLFITFDTNGDGFASKSDIENAGTSWKEISLYDLNSKYASAAPLLKIL